MADRACLRIATAPDSWGVWFPRHPRQMPWRWFLDEVARAGYRYLELGPYGYLPTEPAQLADELGARGLALCGGTVFSGLHRPDGWDELWPRASAIAALITELGATDLVVLPQPWRSEESGADLEDRDLTARQWDRLAAGHDRLGAALRDEYGVTQRFHSHADTHVGTPDQLQRLLEQTAPENLSLCLDTAHYAYYGGDPLTLIAGHPDRIGYLHLKQLDPAVLSRVLADDVPFARCAAELMVPPPDGVPDLVPIIGAVATAAPGAFAVVEQDMPGCALDRPLPIAASTREYLQTCHPMTRMN
ncbi:sugar phosphate isomerase/epimerase family protein [Gordonia sp. VNK21]|uniref:sugar phosphate isomerase/epimerase family protein n=1 Tax=Gordonia sp. VNK21 TaxID=3382483 RepID=UPI0038D425FE